MIYTLPDILLNAGQQFPQKKAVRYKDSDLSYKEVKDESLRLGHALKEMGVKKGDRVCFFLEKRFEKVISIFGISMCGGVFVPIRRLLRAGQAAYIINHCEASVLITTSSRIRSLLDHKDQMPSLRTVVVIDKINDIELPETINVLNWEDIIENSPSSPIDSKLTERDMAAILYTSGSTGKPKGVVLSHLNVVAGAKKVSHYLKMNADEIVLCILSFGFDYGLNQLTTVFLKGAQIVLLDYLFPKDILKAVNEYQITGLAGVATTWIQLLHLSWENSRMNQLRYITNSGGTIPSAYVADLRKRLPTTEIYLMYGLTEAFRSTYLDPCLIDQYPSSIGKAIPGEEIMVLDENDQVVQPGQVGTLVHRGLLVSQGYWGDIASTEAVFRKNPLQNPNIPIPEMVVYSGDYVRIDDQGFLYFIGRKDEMIKCAGNRISPNEIEEVLYSNGLVSDAVSFGVPHDIYGQQVFIVVSLLPGTEVDELVLMNYCKQKMPPYMVPSKIEIWETIPRTSNGKLDRSAVKREVYRRLGLTKIPV